MNNMNNMLQQTNNIYQTIKNELLEQVILNYTSCSDTTARNRAKDIQSIIGAKYHYHGLFKNEIARLKNVQGFDLLSMWFDKKPHHQIRHQSAVYTPNNTLSVILLDIIQRAEPVLSTTDDPKDFLIPLDYIQTLNVLSPDTESKIKRGVFMVDNRKINTIIDLGTRYFVIDNKPTGQYREFTTFNQMPKKLRYLSNYTNELDISAAIQSFSLWFLDSHNLIDPGQFPKTRTLTIRKNLIRGKIQKENNCTYKEAKKAITSLYYGASVYCSLRHMDTPIIRKIEKEAKSIQKLVTVNLHLIDDQPFQDYLLMKTKHHKGKELKNKRFYAFLEYYEKQVRDILDPTHQAMHVHDAVWFSKFPKDIIQRIQTAEKRYNIQIDGHPDHVHHVQHQTPNTSKFDLVTSDQQVLIQKAITEYRNLGIFDKDKLMKDTNLSQEMLTHQLNFLELMGA